MPRVMAYLASFPCGPNMSYHQGGVLVYTESACRTHAWYDIDGLPRLVPRWSQHEWSLRQCSRLHRIRVSCPRLVYHVWWLTSPRSPVVPTWVITKAVFSSTPNPRVVPTPGMPRVMAYLASFPCGPNMSYHQGGVLVYTESACRAHAWYDIDGLPRLVPRWSQHEWSLRQCSRLHRIRVSCPRLVYHVWWLTSPRSPVVPTWVITKAVFSSTPNPRVVPTPGIPRVMAYLASFPGGTNMSYH